MTENTIQETKKQLQVTIEKLRTELEERTELADERLNQLKYLQADFDNYRKKFEKERQDIIELANENLVKELLMIIDDFERALLLVENEKNKEGLILLHKNFFKILEKHGLKKIDALGKKFDSNFHEVLCKEVSGEENDTILEEMQKGFMLKSKVIRPSKVKIAEKVVKEGEKNG